MPTDNASRSLFYNIARAANAKLSKEEMTIVEASMRLGKTKKL